MREIRSLTSLRGLAAIWVVAAHFSNLPGGEWLRNGFVNRGFLAVDIFLVLSGFVLAGAYGESAMTLGGYARFVRRRFFRLFPLHLAVLAVMVATQPVWSAEKVSLETALMHRWHLWPALELQAPPGLLPVINQPDWSLSCEWGLNLALPLFVMLCLKGSWRRSALVGAAAMATPLVLHAIHGGYNIFEPASLLPMIRCAADFAMGFLIFRYRALLPVPRALNAALSIAPLYFLGEISYSMYLTHWSILWALGPTWQALAAILAVSTLTYRLIERPARGWSRGRLEVRQPVITGG